MHKKCSGVNTRLQDVNNFQCSRCVDGDYEKVEVRKISMLANGGKFKCVDTFCYLGD